ncbi:hypothetical protein V496_01578 [Pseudogymnoascus sp. VKM F-4515 (FW-2607)]|nr:hypothetical protein V496_01578 [Pseudogymnoascus sp. VKM F-4515 (FW-2607)]
MQAPSINYASIEDNLIITPHGQFDRMRCQQKTSHFPSDIIQVLLLELLDQNASRKSIPDETTSMDCFPALGKLRRTKTWLTTDLEGAPEHAYEHEQRRIIVSPAGQVRRGQSDAPADAAAPGDSAREGSPGHAWQHEQRDRVASPTGQVLRGGGDAPAGPIWTEPVKYSHKALLQACPIYTVPLQIILSVYTRAAIEFTGDLTQRSAGHHPVIPAVDHTPQFSAAKCHLIKATSASYNSTYSDTLLIKEMICTDAQRTLVATRLGCLWSMAEGWLGETRPLCCSTCGCGCQLWLTMFKFTSGLAKVINEFDDLVQLLNSTEANYTCFAPTNEAFKHLSGPHKKPSKEVIKAILEYHLSPDLCPLQRLLLTHTLRSDIEALTRVNLRRYRVPITEKDTIPSDDEEDAIKPC